MNRKEPPPQKPSSSGSEDDRSLWDRVKKTVDPLDARQRQRYSRVLAEYLESGEEVLPSNQPKRQAGGAIKHHEPLQPAPKHPHTTKSGATKPRPPQTPPLVDLDRKTRSRIAKGRTPIDARLDLHGLRQHEAMEVLRSFIWRAHANGHRTVLVITGKGSRQRDPGPQAPPWAVGSGILRKAVPNWLAAPDMRSAVLSVEPAHASHGGEGALYVRLRARKKDQA
ncbi:MAG: Smr/MutS family protein [Pseudomonadota bacterium]